MINGDGGGGMSSIMGLGFRVIRVKGLGSFIMGRILNPQPYLS